MRYMIVILLLSVLLFSSEFNKIGFLTTLGCIKEGSFRDCPLETYSCGYKGCFLENDVGDNISDNLVLYVHKEGIYYTIDSSPIKTSIVDKLINSNNIRLIGEYDEVTNMVRAVELKKF